jgi:Tfp pilus assembly protein PilO
LCASFAKLPGDLWNGRGVFAPLAEVARWRIVLVECALLVLVCGGVYLLRYEARAARYREALGRTSEQLRSVVLELEAERRDLSAARLRRDLLAGFILDKDSRASLLSSLTDPALHPGLEFISISPQPKEDLEQYARCRSLVTVEATFDDLLRFVRWLETEGTPCSLVQLDVDSQYRSRRTAAERAAEHPDALDGGPLRRLHEMATAPGEATGGERITLLLETYAQADPPRPGEQPKR